VFGVQERRTRGEFAVSLLELTLDRRLGFGYVTHEAQSSASGDQRKPEIWDDLMLEEAINSLLERPPQSTKRLTALADLLKDRLEAGGLPGARGGSGGELKVPGLSRVKDWDVAYEFAGKFRLLVSLKSMLRNISGSVPNRLDDLQGELANIQQLRPEIVIGYVILFDIAEDSVRQRDGRPWSNYFEDALRSIAIRKAPLWNQGLLEGLWFIRFDSRRKAGQRVRDPVQTEAAGDKFIRALLCELRLREPAIAFTRDLDCEQTEPLPAE
jgi:hypothetical protein